MLTRSRTVIASAAGIFLISIEAAAAQSAPEPNAATGQAQEKIEPSQTGVPQGAQTAPDAPPSATAQPENPGKTSAGQVELPPVVVTDEPEPKSEKTPATEREVRKRGPVAPSDGQKKRRRKTAAQKSNAAPAVAATASPPTPVSQPSAVAGSASVTGAQFASETVVPTEALNADQGATLTDSLENRPGISGSAFAPGANRPILRGLDDNRVRVQENGLNASGVSDLSEDHAIPISPCTTDRVSVIHGPAGLLYTDKVVGGVVNAENQMVPTVLPAGGFATEIQGGLTSADDGRDGCFKTSAEAGGFVAHSEGFAQKSDDYRTPRGRQLNSFVDSKSGALGGSYIWSDGFAGLAYSRFDSLYGIPGAEAGIEASSIDMVQDKISGKAEWRLHDARIKAIRGAFGYSDYAHSELDTDVASGATDIGSRFLNKEWEGRLEISQADQQTPFGTLGGVAGIQVSTRDLTGLSFEGDSLLEPSRTTKTAGFMQQDLQLTDALKLSGSLRVEQTDVSGATYADIAAMPPQVTAYDRNFLSTSGGVGLLYDLPLGMVVRFSALYSERAPEAQELFSKGAHDATSTFEIGNPDLKEERAGAFEAGLKRAAGGVRFDTSLFYNKYDGFIFRQLTGEQCDGTLASCTPAGGGGELDQVIFGQRDATFYGAEFTGEVDVARLWNGVWGISAQYDFVHATFDDGGYVPRMPPHRLGGGFSYRDPNWTAKVFALHAFAQDQIAAGETATAGYTLVSAELSHTFAFNDTLDAPRAFTIGIKGENLLDDDVRFSTSFKKDEVLQPGRSVRVFGRLNF